ncbi:MAG: hypothetical protein ACTSU0_05045, partial [Alphaproteobacteria bacterium]
GREVSLPLLLHVTGLDAEGMAKPVENLLASQLMSRGLLEGEEAIQFRHALIRDGAYQSMLSSRRREIHHNVATVLEQEFKNLVESQPELLARHFAEAAKPDAAVAYWRRAGDRATRLVANREAVGHYRNALGQLDGLPASEERTKEEIRILLALGVPLIGATGYTSDDVRDNYARARDLSLQSGDDDVVFTAIRGLWNCTYDRGDLDVALDLAQSLVDLAATDSKSTKALLARRALGSTHMIRGALAAAITDFEACISIGKSIPMSAALREHGEAPQIIARQYKGWTQCIMGNLDTGLDLSQTAVEQARELGHPMTLDFALNTLACARLLRREYAHCRDIGLEMKALSDEHGFIFWKAGGNVLLGCAVAHLGDGERGLAMAVQAIRDWRALGAVLHLPTWWSLLADAALNAGALEEHSAAISDGIRTSQANHDLFVLSELQRLDAHLALHRGDGSAAVAGLEAAIATARQLGARLFELRACTDLARLLMQEDKTSEAKHLLAPVYAAFNEGLECADLKEARKLLDRLG